MSKESSQMDAIFDWYYTVPDDERSKFADMMEYVAAHPGSSSLLMPAHRAGCDMPSELLTYLQAHYVGNHQETPAQ